LVNYYGWWYSSDEILAPRIASKLLDLIAKPAPQVAAANAHLDEMLFYVKDRDGYQKMSEAEKAKLLLDYVELTPAEWWERVTEV